MKKAIFNWSGGKDSAIALYEVMQNKEFEIEALVTTVNKIKSRISMHGVREQLLDMQAKSIGLPLHKVMLDEMPSMEEYNAQMKSMLDGFKSNGISHSIFGDIFLEDLKEFRDKKLAQVGVKGFYPIWKRDSYDIMRQFIDLGFKSVVVCTNSSYLDESFLGRDLDDSFMKDLPDNVDVCGENGEFHTFVYDGPIFDAPISFKKGKKVFRDYSKDQKDNLNHDTGFWYLDLLAD